MFGTSTERSSSWKMSSGTPEFFRLLALATTACTWQDHMLVQQTWTQILQNIKPIEATFICQGFNRNKLSNKQMLSWLKKAQSFL